jgi:hypothetical protein
MKDEQLPELNSELSSIESKIKNIQSKYESGDKELEQKDLQFLLSVLDQIDEKLLNLKDDEPEEESENQ